MQEILVWFPRLCSHRGLCKPQSVLLFPQISSGKLLPALASLNISHFHLPRVGSPTSAAPSVAELCMHAAALPGLWPVLLPFPVCSPPLSLCFLSPCWQEAPQILHSTFCLLDGSVYTPSFHSPYWGPTQSALQTAVSPRDPWALLCPGLWCAFTFLRGAGVGQEVIRVSDVKAKPWEAWAEHCCIAKHQQESWNSYLIYRQLQGCLVLWNRRHRGKHVSPISPC